MLRGAVRCLAGWLEGKSRLGRVEVSQGCSKQGREGPSVGAGRYLEVSDGPMGKLGAILGGYRSVQQVMMMSGAMLV